MNFLKELKEATEHDRLMKHLVKQNSRRDIHKHGQSFIKTQLMYDGFDKREY